MHFRVIISIKVERVNVDASLVLKGARDNSRLEEEEMQEELKNKLCRIRAGLVLSQLLLILAFTFRGRSFPSRADRSTDRLGVESEGTLGNEGG